LPEITEDYLGKRIHLGDDGVLTVDGRVIDFVQFPDGRYGTYETAYVDYGNPIELARALLRGGLIERG
jgi:hypothetical protein